MGRIVKGTLLLVVLTGFGCGDATNEPVQTMISSNDYLFVSNASTDFQSGSFGLIDISTFDVASDLGALHGDSFVQFCQWENAAYLFGLNRFGADNVQRIDPETFQTLWQYSTGAGTNPQEIEVVSSGRAYVTRHNSNEILIINAEATSDAEFAVGTIDLSTFADEDGFPEMGPMVSLDNLIFVALQRLDRDASFTVAGPSVLVAIDPTTDTLVDLSDQADGNELEMPYPNPISMRVAESLIWIASAGDYGVTDGGLFRFDPSSNAFEAAIVDEAQLGGDILAFTATDPSFIVWADESYTAHLGVIDIEAGQVLEELVADLTLVQDIAADDQYVYVPDRSATAPGIRIFDRSTFVEVTTQPIQTGLPPWSVERVRLAD